MHHLNREQETIRLTLFRDIGEILHAKRIDLCHKRPESACVYRIFYDFIAYLKASENAWKHR